MPNFGSDVDGFTVNKTNQEICNSHNKNETNMTITFTIKHDKFYELLFFTPNMIFIRLLVEKLCVEFYDQLKLYYINELHKHTHTHIRQNIHTVTSSINVTAKNIYNTT